MTPVYLWAVDDDGRPVALRVETIREEYERDERTGQIRRHPNERVVHVRIPSTL